MKLTPISKICSRCKIEKSFSEFHKRKSRKSGLCSFCKECSKLRIKNYIKNNRETHLKNARKNSTKNYQKIVSIIEKIKDVPCKDCGIKYIKAVMHFDHLPQYEKKFSLNLAKEHSLNDILEEIKKCEIVCANCHRLRTHLRYQRKSKPPSPGSYIQYIYNTKHNKQCIDCKNTFPHYLLEYDHIAQRGLKLFRLAGVRKKTIEEINQEIAKCDLVCSNCHHIRSDKRRNQK